MLSCFKLQFLKFQQLSYLFRFWILSTQQLFHARLTCKLLRFPNRIQRLCSIFFLLLCSRVSNWKAARICIRIWIYSEEFIQAGFLSANHSGIYQLQTHLLRFLFRVYILLCLCLKIFCIYTLKSLRRYQDALFQLYC